MKPVLSQSAVQGDDSISSTEKLATHPNSKPKWSLKRKLLIGGGVTLIVITALAVGLGVGLSRRNRDTSDNDDNTSSSNPFTFSNTTDPSFNATTMWAPPVGTTWDYVLRMPLPTTTSAGTTKVWGIDLFDNNRSTITNLQSQGAKVICYFSAGSYENWRPDRDQWNPADLGHNLKGWEGEQWVNVSSPTVRKLMLSRLDMAVQKGCNGVDPDNVDGYDNDNGLDLTKAQAIDFMKFLATAAHTRGMSLGLKNAGAIIPQVLPYVQWSVNEQCAQFNECETYAAFIRAGKPVFHVEYPKGDKKNDNNSVDAAAKVRACGNAAAEGFSTIIKNMNLDLWIQTCS